MLGTHFLHNNQLLPITQANLPLDNIEFSYGFGVYETLRVRNTQAVFIHEHIERLFYSAQIIGIEHTFDTQYVFNAVNQLLQKNNIEVANLKVLLIGGRTKQDATLYAFLLAPKFLEKKEYREGISVITFEHERFLPQAKTLNMLPSYIAYQKAHAAAAFDALLIDRHQNITEGTRTNFFALKEKTLFTPPLAQVLDGITRRHVIACALQNGYMLKEEIIPLKNIFDYDGAFLTNTSGGIIPIRTIDGQSFSQICDTLKNLQTVFEEFRSEQNIS